MFPKWFSLTVMLAILAAATACAPSTASEEVISIQNDETTIESVPLAGSPNEAGSSEFGAAEGELPTDIDQPSLEQQAMGPSLVYTNAAYRFSLEYPADFTLLELTDGQLEGLIPLPLAGYRFMNPQAAASDIAELEPGDLEVRVYDSLKATSLKEWLAASGLGGEGLTTQEFDTTSVSGLKVCLSTMVFPGCSYLVLDGQWVYQLIPVNQAGEAMFNTFQIQH
jgi:hypothetical protein